MMVSMWDSAEVLGLSFIVSTFVGKVQARIQDDASHINTRLVESYVAG
jgi:hypothetical protein